jgi:hypothetical protein
VKLLRYVNIQRKELHLKQTLECPGNNQFINCEIYKNRQPFPEMKHLKIRKGHISLDRIECDNVEAMNVFCTRGKYIYAEINK